MRKSVFILIGLQIALVLFAFLGMGSSGMDAAERSTTMGFLTIFAVLGGLFCIPAVFLALTDKWPSLAVTLAAAPLAFLIFTLASG